MSDEHPDHKTRHDIQSVLSRLCNQNCHLCFSIYHHTVCTTTTINIIFTHPCTQQQCTSVARIGSGQNASRERMRNISYQTAPEQQKSIILHIPKIYSLYSLDLDWRRRFCYFDINCRTCLGAVVQEANVMIMMCFFTICSI